MAALLIKLFASCVVGAGAILTTIFFLLFYLIFSATKADN